jgi:eukaryotic-like serine/threonine-protein kinase
MRVPAGGGEPEVLTKPDQASKEQDHMFPSYLPGGRAVVFAITASGSVDNSQVAVLDLTTGKYRSLIRGGTHPQYVNSGHLVYAVAGSLRAVGFDLDSLAVTSDPVPVTEQVGMTTTGATQYAVSETGTLVYVPGGVDGAGAARSLVWVDRKGQEIPVAGAPVRSYTIPRLSHDNSRLAVAADDLESDIVVFDFALRTPTRATFGPNLDSMAVWYPGDERFLFISARDGNPNLYSQRADGIGGVQRLTYSKNNQFLPTMSPDGKLVVMLEQRPTTGNDLVLLRLDSTGPQTSTPPGAGSSTGQKGLTSEPLVYSTASEIHPEISPDGRWLAYTSGESGKNEVFVTTFPDVSGGKWQVSTDGGSRPAWSPAGGELFYVTPNGTMMSVPLEPGPVFKRRNPEKLFDWPSIGAPSPGRTYDVSRDGRRFLMIKEGGGSERRGETATIRVVLNWVEELKAKLPQ